MSELLPEGFEGIISEGEQPEIVSNLAHAFQGIIISDGYFYESRQALAFEGIILAYENEDEKFIKVMTSSGRPFAGCTVEVTNNVAESFTANTNVDGYVNGIFDLTGIITVRLRSGNSYFDYEIDADTQQLTTVLEFPLGYV